MRCELRANPQSGGTNALNAGGSDAFIEPNMLARRTGQDASVPARHDVTTPAVNNMIQYLRIRLEAQHLTANRFDAKFRHTDAGIARRDS